MRRQTGGNVNQRDDCARDGFSCLAVKDNTERIGKNIDLCSNDNHIAAWRGNANGQNGAVIHTEHAVTGHGRRRNTARGNAPDKYPCIDTRFVNLDLFAISGRCLDSRRQTINFIWIAIGSSADHFKQNILTCPDRISLACAQTDRIARTGTGGACCSLTAHAAGVEKVKIASARCTGQISADFRGCRFDLDQNRV